MARRVGTRGVRVVASAVTAVALVAGCAATASPLPAGPVAPPATAPARPTLPPIDLAALEPGLGWAKVYDVERPEAAFALPTALPTGPTGPGTAGHPGHFPGQAIVADVVATDDGLVAVGYVGQPWTAIAWTSIDGLAWDLATIDLTEASFAVAVAAVAGGRVVAVGRVGREPAAWTSPDGRRWTRVRVDTVADGAEAERMTEVLSTSDVLIAGGSAGPELGARHARFWTSVDGRTWSPSPDDASFAGAEVTEIEPFGDGYLALGRLGDGQRGTGTVGWQSADGARWSPVAKGELGDGLATAMAVTADGGLVAVGSDADEREARVWTSDRDATWTRLPAEPSRLHFGQKIRMTDVVPTPGGLVAVGNQVEVQFGTGLSWRSDDGRLWRKSPLQPSFGQGEPLAVTVAGDRLVAVGSHGAPDNYVPTVWLSPLPGG